MTLPLPFNWPPPIPTPPAAPITSDDVANLSGVPGATVTAALDDLDTTVHALNQLRVYLAAAQNTPNNTWGKILYDTVAWDTAGGWSAANRRYVIPAAGYYLIGMRARTDTASAAFTSVISTGFAQNGVLRSGVGGDSTGFASGGMTLAQCAAGDTIEGWVFTSTVRVLTVTGVAGFDVWLSVTGPLLPF
jgi:hypothetical protein